MSYGVYADATLQQVFEQVNSGDACQACRRKRYEFAEYEKRHHDRYSNLLPGFSSGRISKPIDVFIIGNAHAGTDPGSYREQGSLDAETEEMALYYTQTPDKTFHQQQVRLLLAELDLLGKTWVFSDLIRCFVWQKGREGQENMRIALSHCRRYLEDQIKVCQPGTVVSLGGAVARELGVTRPKHGVVTTVDYANTKLRVVHSLFPSGWTADHWVRQGGREPVLERLIA